MAKIAQVSAKYIVHASITIDGLVDRPDVIGAIFGQTEGLLGNDLELRELQRSGRIGRIEVNVTAKGGKSQGEIIIPSSLDKAETAIVGAALEIIQRIGPCNAKIKVTNIEDIRISKRQYVVDRAKDLLKTMVDSMMPDSQELSDEVSHSVRVMEVTEWGPDRLAAGPGAEEGEEIILVEGRADVVNLLKHGFKNAVSVNGTSIPASVKDLCHEKVVTVFVDGDRGGDLIIKALMEMEIDFVCKAPDGKEVEELTMKEIHKSIRAKIAAEQYKLEGGMPKKAIDRPARAPARKAPARTTRAPARTTRTRAPPRERAPRAAPARKAKALSEKEKTELGKLLEDLLGTHGAYVLDAKMKILGKVPGTELISTITALKEGMHAIVYDGKIEKELVQTCEKARISFIVGMSSGATSRSAKILTSEDIL
ncbi:MAG: DNA primase DnaG [Candidatus Woesearchaeota archaeon]|nr:DNA primase DnaG [Candidatus Woesearchaeota archaeon]